MYDLLSPNVILGVVFLGLLTELLATWSSVSYDVPRCEEPVHLWLLGDYIALAGFRVVVALAYRDSVRMDERWRVCCLGTVFCIGAPFLMAWTVLGTVWYVQAVEEDCVNSTQLLIAWPWLFPVLLFLGYAIFTTLLYAFCCTHFLRIRNAPAQPASSMENLDSTHPLDPDEMTRLERHIWKFKAGRDTPTCSICTDDFTVSEM